MSAPLITIYYRILSNVDETPITDFVLVDKGKDLTLNYGHINTLKGGESPYIIEFDIWNNEPAFDGGMLPSRVKDAKNCSFEVWDNEYLRTHNKLGFTLKQRQEREQEPAKINVLARCVTLEKGDWINISGPNGLNRDHIYGNVSPNNPGVLRGQPGGDHTVIQTKIHVPPSKNLNEDFKFTFNFEYDFDE